MSIAERTAAVAVIHTVSQLTLGPNDALAVVASDKLTMAQTAQFSESLLTFWDDHKMPGAVVVLPGFAVRELKVVRERKATRSVKRGN